ncbi:protein LURP-one-related 15-like [Apium graveolens]|uniref:protein LURP-one-related 15-like n=1 Tax=Apium graveolens TaxID=4045 RepID=UPI003D7BE181
MPEVVVVGRQYTTPSQVGLKMVKKTMTGANGNTMFQVISKSWTLRSRRFLVDAVNNHIVSFEKKLTSMHSTRRVYRGDSEDPGDLLFTVTRTSLFQTKIQLDVFLASNTSQVNPDFKVKGARFEQSCTIYAGNSATVIAQMDHKGTVTVYPHVDRAFIFALIVILQEIDEECTPTNQRKVDLNAPDFGSFLNGLMN